VVPDSTGIKDIDNDGDGPVLSFALRRAPTGLTVSGVERHDGRLLVHFEVQVVR
jgi:hypothetical protein